MKLYGKNPVIERLKSNPKSIKKIYIQQAHPEEGYIRKKGRKWGLSVFAVPKSKIQKLARSMNSQGIVADVYDYEYLPFNELCEFAKEKRICLLFLDGLNDPQNLGSIIRSAACLGRFGLILPTHKSVGVTETVLRVACGGDNYVKISRVSNLTNAISTAKKAGFTIAGSVVKDGEDLSKASLSFPLGLVVGSEDKGIRDVIRKQLDLALTIPMAAERMSLNVSQATALLFYEVARQMR